MELMKKRGYMVRLYGGQEVYVETLNHLRLLVEARLEWLINKAKEDKFIPVITILEDITSTIAFTEVKSLDLAESVEFSLEEKNIRDFFDFKISITKDKVLVKTIDKKKKKKSRK